MTTTSPAQASHQPMKDHHQRELVNRLRDIAVEFHATGQLRARIAQVVGEFIDQHAVQTGRTQHAGLAVAAYRVTSQNTGKARLMKKSMTKVWERAGFTVTPLYEVVVTQASAVSRRTEDNLDSVRTGLRNALHACTARDRNSLE